MRQLNCKVIMEANDLRLDSGGFGFRKDQVVSLNVRDEDTIKPIQIKVLRTDENGAIVAVEMIDRGEYQTITAEPYTAASGFQYEEESESGDPELYDAYFTVDWRMKSVSIVDSYYMFSNPFIEYQHNTNGEVKPVVDCKGYLYDVSITKAGFGFTQQPIITVKGLTEAEIYYKVWQGDIIDENRMKSMTDTISHFEKLGYNIQRRVNPDTGNTFEWVVSWNS